MGKFDGILLATDLDGTLAKGLEFNKVDLETIEYFKSEGGLFTLATGRAYEYVKTYIIPKVQPNAPVITLNGSVICNSTCTELIYKSFIDGFKERIDYIISFSDHIEEFYVYYENCISAHIIKTVDYINKKAFIDHKKLIHKIVFSFKDQDKAIEVMNSANNIFSQDSNVCFRSWPTGLELLNKSNTKDSAVLMVKKMTNSKILVCAGDFENDIPMIKVADIGYAVGNALDHVKKEADRISASQENGAIAHIIHELPSLL